MYMCYTRMTNLMSIMTPVSGEKRIRSSELLPSSPVAESALRPPARCSETSSQGFSSSEECFFRRRRHGHTRSAMRDFDRHYACHV